jgi:hypothetical protein
MRIISKFKDYYDSALAYGFENDRVLVRHNQTWNAKKEGNPVNEPASAFLEKLKNITKEVSSFEAFGTCNQYERRPKNAHLQITPLVFCVGGRIAKALWVLDLESVRLNNESQWLAHTRSPPYFSRSHAPFLPDLNPADQHNSPKTFEPHPTDKLRQDGPIFDANEFETRLAPWVDHYKNIYGDAKGDSSNRIILLKKWLAEPAPDLYTEAIAEKVSLAVVHPQGISVNPSLKDWRFFKYWDASTCMQELSMFVGNMSHPDSVPDTTPDKYRVQSHGFDELSFRKQPTKHGLPKRAKRPHPDTPGIASDTDLSP